MHLLVRGPKLRASGAMQDRINDHAHVDIHYNTAVDDVTGDSKGVTGLKIRKTDSGMPSATAKNYTDVLRNLRHNAESNAGYGHLPAVHRGLMECVS